MEGDDVVVRSPEPPVVGSLRLAPHGVHDVVVLCGGLDTSDVKLLHPEVGVDDAEQGGDAVAQAGAAIEHLHAGPESVLIQTRQKQGQSLKV